MWKKRLLLLLAFCSVTFIHCQFECHDDPTHDPGEGTLLDLQFTWLGALQYIHGYMLPVCLPFMNHIANGSQGGETFFHIDFSSEVPRDFLDEEKEVTRLDLLPKDSCRFNDDNENLTNINFKRVICSNGCGFHSGAPTVVHEHTGHWSVVAMAQGGSPCPDPLRPGPSPPPPRHVLLLPYVPWITAAITGRPMNTFLKDDPFGYIMPRASNKKELHRGWVGHWWMGGIRCYDRGKTADDLFRFYHEIFQITPILATDMSYYIQIDAAYGAVIVCVKIGMPYNLGNPKIWELETSSIKLRIPVKNIRKRYKIIVEAWARNGSDGVKGDTDEEKDNYSDVSKDYD